MLRLLDADETHEVLHIVAVGSAGLLAGEVGELLQLGRHLANALELSGRQPAVRTGLDLAANAGCEYIVTYNKRHFQGIEAFGLEVVTAKEFLQAIGELS